MGKIVDGIDIETGEVVDPNVVPQYEIEEVHDDQGRIEKAGIINKIWPDLMVHFDSDDSGYIIIEDTTSHAQTTVPITIRFEYKNKTIFLKSPVLTQIKSFNVEKQFVDIDKYIDEKELTKLSPEEKKRFRATMTFRKLTPFMLASAVSDVLQTRIYRIIMIIKKDVMLYSRLDKKVLLGESLIEKIIRKGDGFIVTEKDGEEKYYLYQSVLETKSTTEIIELINKP